MANQGKQKKSKSSKSSSGSSSLFKFFFVTSLLFGAFAGFIAYDTHKHDGKFEETSVGQVLKSAGALPHVENAWMVSMKYSARGYKWTEENAPVYYGKTKTVRTMRLNLFQTILASIIGHPH